MNRAEAERIYDAGKEAVVETLLKMDARIRELEKLEQRVVELEQIIARLTRNSSNSSRPPSSDPPGSIKLKRKKPSRRKQGGQPGHKGKKRELLPAAEMDHIHDLFPGQCSSCNRPFDPLQQVFSSQPYRHQVAELPKITPELTEYRCHTLRCSCGQETVASLPDEVVKSEFGPGVHAAIGYLMATHRVSRRGIVDIFATLFNLHIATGTVCNAAERALRPAVQWRKNCYGSQSIIGERFAESLLSVTATCKLHGVNAFHFLTAVVRASFSTKHPLPDLPLALPN